MNLTRRRRLGWQDHLVPRRLEQRRFRRRDQGPAATPTSTTGAGQIVRGRHRPDRRAAQGSARPRRGTGPPGPGRWSSSPTAGPSSVCGSSWAARTSQCGRDKRSDPGHRRLRVGPDAWWARFCAGPMHGAVSPPNNTGDGAAHGDGARRGSGQHGRSLVGTDRPASPATPSRASRAAAACDWSAPGPAASSSTGPARDSSTRPATTTRWPAPSTTSIRAAAMSTIRPGWCSTRCTSSSYGFLGIEPGGPAPDWFNQSADLDELGEKTGIDADGLTLTLQRWNDNVAAGDRPRLRPGFECLRRLLGRRRGHHHCGKDSRPHRHRAVLRGADLDRLDGHQGRPAHR